MLCVHAGGVLSGAIMANGGSPFALRYRDQLVERAHAQDPASSALAKGHRLEAAAWDFGRNLVLGAIPSTVGGLAIGVPYLIAMHRGWVGGIPGGRRGSPIRTGVPTSPSKVAADLDRPSHGCPPRCSLDLRPRRPAIRHRLPPGVSWALMSPRALLSRRTARGGRRGAQTAAGALAKTATRPGFGAAVQWRRARPGGRAAHPRAR